MRGVQQIHARKRQSRRTSASLGRSTAMRVAGAVLRYFLPFICVCACLNQPIHHRALGGTLAARRRRLGCQLVLARRCFRFGRLADATVGDRHTLHYRRRDGEGAAIVDVVSVVVMVVVVYVTIARSLPRSVARPVPWRLSRSIARPVAVVVMR